MVVTNISILINIEKVHFSCEGGLEPRAEKD